MAIQPQPQPHPFQIRQLRAEDVYRPRPGCCESLPREIAEAAEEKKSELTLAILAVAVCGMALFVMGVVAMTENLNITTSLGSRAADFSKGLSYASAVADGLTYTGVGLMGAASVAAIVFHKKIGLSLNKSMFTVGVLVFAVGLALIIGGAAHANILRIKLPFSSVAIDHAQKVALSLAFTGTMSTLIGMALLYFTRIVDSD